MTETVAGRNSKPMLLFFYSSTSGSSRRAEGFLAQVLQRRGNHDTFEVRRVEFDAHTDLATRLGIEHPTALVVVEQNRVRGKLEQPRGCGEIRDLLTPWLK